MLERMKLEKGPWKPLFQGVFQGYESEMLSNEDKWLLAGIFEETDAGKGLLLQLYAPLTVHGSLEGFIPYFEKEAVMFSIFSRAGKHEFFLLKSHPVYLNEFDEVKVNEELKDLVKKLSALSLTIKSIAKPYNIELIDLNESSSDEIDAFFTEPMAIPAVLARTKRELKVPAAVPLISKLINLGLTRKKEPIEESIESLGKTLVVQGNDFERKHAIHLIIEGFLLNHYPVIVFDSMDSFKGLGEPSKELSRLSEFRVGFEPIGFPIKSFEAIRDLKADLSLLNGEALTQLYGFSYNEASAKITKIINENKLGSLDELIKAIEREQIDAEFNEFNKKQAVREIKLVQEMNPGLFNAKNDLGELFKTSETIGRLAVINLHGLNETEKTLIVHSIIKGLNELKEGKALIVLLESKNFSPAIPANVLQLEIIEALKSISKKGISYVVETEHRIDLNPEILNDIEAEITIIKENDAGLELKHRRPYRLFLRPGLSICEGHSLEEKPMTPLRAFTGKEKIEQTFA